MTLKTTFSRNAYVVVLFRLFKICRYVQLNQEPKFATVQKCLLQYYAWKGLNYYSRDTSVSSSHPWIRGNSPLTRPSLHPRNGSPAPGSAPVSAQPCQKWGRAPRLSVILARTARVDSCLSRVPSGGPGCGDTVHPAAALLPHIRQHVDDVPDVDCHRHQLGSRPRHGRVGGGPLGLDGPVAEGLWELMGQQIVDRLNWESPRCYAYCFVC